MNNEDGNQAAKRRRAAEAASIVRRLDENPEDASALEDRDTFLARGKAERRTYENVERAFAVAPKGLRNRDRKYGIALLCLILASLYLASEPARIGLLADYRTGSTIEVAELASGDTATLDASSAIRDATDEDVRTVTLMKGAGFFEVNGDGRRFIVTTGDVTVEAIGTKFEVSRLDDVIIVTVADGVVEVETEGSLSRLEAGSLLRISPDHTETRTVRQESVASWRHQQLIMNGMTLAEVVAVLDRRLPGKIVVIGHTLRDAEMAGGLDLTSPSNALRTLAASSNAQVIQAFPFLTVVRLR